MRLLRTTVVSVVLLAASAAPTAHAAPRSDQQCEGQHLGGASGGTFSQTFRPTDPTLGRLDVLLLSDRKRGPDPLRLRVVRKKSLSGGIAAQGIVLAEQQVRLPLQPRRASWAVIRFPEPIVLAAGASPAFDQLAIELVLPQFDNSLFWVGCTKYDRGQGSAEGAADGGLVLASPRTLQPYGLDLGPSVTHEIGFDLAFKSYATNR